MSRRRALIPATVLALAVLVPLVAQEKPAEDAYVRAHYTKHEFEIPMRDGVTLFTAVYVPKDRSTSYPIILQRTPYSVCSMPLGSLGKFNLLLASGACTCPTLAVVADYCCARRMRSAS